MGVGRPWKGSLGSPWILKFLVKKIVFLILSGKKISPLMAPHRKISEKSPSGPLGKILATPMPT